MDKSVHNENANGFYATALTVDQMREFALAVLCGRKYPKSWYQVFECNSPDMHDYEGSSLFESDCLAKAHSYAYQAWKKSDKTRLFTVIQPYDGSCRGGYGFNEE